MKTIFKRLPLLWLVVFSSLLWAPDSDNVSITVTDASSVYESNGPLRFTIQLSESPIFPVTVDYTTADGTAKAGEDYNATSGSVTFYTLQTTKTIEVPIQNDNRYEPSEYLSLHISSSASGYSVTDSVGIGYIHDDDTLPIEATIYDRGVYENDNNWVLYFTVALNQNAPHDITLNFKTIDNSAKDGEDYLETNGTITISQGTDHANIPVTIIGDTMPEGTEDFKVYISSISEGTITKDTATGTIVDDDAIKVYMDSQDVNEGDVGDNNKMPFKIYLKKDYPLDTPLTIHYATEDGSSTPSATAGEDYRAKSGDITFHKGDKEFTIYVDIIGDNDIEDDEFLQMNLSGSSSIVTTKSQALILNDDGEYPNISLDSTEFSIVEGNSSQTNLDFKFTLDKPSVAGSSFHYETYDDTAQDESGDNDYIYTHGDKNLTVGTTTFTISVPINGDTKIEDDESFYFSFSNLNNLNYGSSCTAKGTIINDDGSYPTLSFTNDNFSIQEGNSGQKDINFTLTLDLPALKNSHFDYYTRDGSASSSDDFIEVNRTTFNIPEGEQNITIPITINGDTTIENDETFYLIIDNESDNLNISGTQSPTATIINDDGSFPQIDIEQDSYSTIEGNNSTHTITIKLLLDKPALKDTQIDYYTEDKEAEDGTDSTEDNDYQSSSGTIDIDENSTSATVTLTINEDRLVEPNEDFKLYIENAKNATIGRDSATITIINDDEHNEEPFVCDEHMYLSSSRKRGTEVTGKMWLHRIDISQSPFRFEVLDDTGEDKLYNALAYSEKDNYIYGLYYKELFKISKTGKVMSLGEVSQLPDFMSSKQAFAGASYNGYYYVTGFGVDYDKIYKIKLSDTDTDRTVDEINLTTAVSINDFSFSPDGKYLYGITYGGKLTKIDVNSGDVSFIGEAHDGYAFDSSFSDKNGRFFANDGGGKGFFEFNLADGTKRFLSDSQPADYNDGTNCIKSALVFTDYGDAPHQNGKYYGEAWHNIIGGLYLGDKVDHDIQTYANDTATGDDTNGTDDEDGVTLVDGTPLDGAYLEDNSTQQLKVKLSKDGYLRIWIDLNIDGHFDNGHDLVYDNRLSAGEHTIDIVLPDGLTKGITTYLRARVSSTPAMDYQGYLSDGEVEDYAIKFGSATQALRGVFNIERTNSGSYPINSDDRNAWFTQIVGRDFDYSLVFYEEDMSAQKELDDVTLKIDLIDEDTNATLYTKYAYIKNTPPKSRIDNTLPNDLDTLPATKRAIFKITYGVNGDGSIIQAPCTTDPQTCFDALPDTASVYAKDDFAIRPDYFHMIIYDNNSSIRVSTAPDNNTSLKVASGYDYNLSITASSYNGNDATPSANYSGTAKRVLEFLDKSNTNCLIKDDINSTENFINGKNITNLLEVQESGKYRLHIVDDSWSSVDIAKGDCDINSSSISSDGNIKSGCNIISTKDINLTFYPDHFAINLTVQNLPNSSHNDFIYMSEMNSTFNSVAIAYQGSITAQSEDNSTTQNFTNGCMAQNLLLGLDATTLSDTGLNSPLKTSDGNTDVNFVRTIEFNSDGNITVDKNIILDNLPTINITADKFISEHNGSTNIDIRYNIDKNLSKTINPIKITFHSFESNSTSSSSIAHNQESPMYIPKGYQNLGDTIRNFYFAQLAPDKVNYPPIDFHIENTIRTPIQVEIFCGDGVSRTLCSDTNLTEHIYEPSSPRAEMGWYLSIDHNSSVDGKIIGLIPNSTNPNVLNITPATPIELTNGRVGTIMTKFTNPVGKKRYRVDIFCSPQLKHYSGVTKTGPTGATIPQGVPDYNVFGSDDNSSTWTGIGNTGRVLEMKSNRKTSHRLDW